MNHENQTIGRLQEEAQKRAEQIPENPPRAQGTIETAGIIYKDGDGYLRFDRATRHANPEEVIAGLLADNPQLWKDVMFWYDAFKDTPGNNAREAMHGH